MNIEEQERYYKLGNDYWWLSGKYITITNLLRSLKSFQRSNLSILDMGCGPGNMLDHLSKFGSVTGTDLSHDALYYCHQRGYRRLFIGSGENLPAKNGQFDLIVALDVLEHIEDDEAALKDIYRTMKPGGHLILSVPAYMFLWGRHDQIYGHKRRYTARKLKRLVDNAGFNVEKLTYFEAPYIIPLFLFRNIKKFLLKDGSRDDFISLPGWLNAMLKMLIVLEGQIVKYFNLPFGVTIICFAKK